MPEAILSNRYKILKKLGEGGFGQTFLAEDLHLPTAPQCVVKRLKPEFADEESYKLARRLFEQEADILYRLGNHPNIPNLLAHFEENGEFFLAQELIDGWTLAEEFASGRRYKERDAVDLLRQILETLAFVHCQNVIHRDIKPTNLIRRRSDGRVFLIDFGAVKQVSINPFNQNPTFQSTVAIGSHGYMPPEQTAGKPRFSSDLYAAGLVVIEALTGINPLQLTQNRTTGEFLWQHKAQIHGEIGNLISRLVRYDFRQRYMSAKEAFAALNMLASSLGYGRRNPAQVQPNQPLSAVKIPQPTPNLPVNQTLASTVAVMPYSQQTVPKLPPIEYQNQPKNEESKGFLSSLWNNDFALGGIIVALVFGFFFVTGYALVRYATASDKGKAEDTAPVPAAKPESATFKTFEEAKRTAAEASNRELTADTKAEWDQVAEKYKIAYQQMALIEAGSPEYIEAQEKMREYHAKHDEANQKGGMYLSKNGYVTNQSNQNYSNGKNYTSSYPNYSSTPYPSSTPKAKPVVTMPPKKSHKTYLTYTHAVYDRLETKVITTDDAIFTTSVEKQSSNRRDSGVVRINIDGGSYSSSRLAFKAPFGQKVTAGNFSSAQEYLWQSPTMYAVSFDKLSCYESANHSFTINNIIYDELYSNIAFIDATFTIRCGERRLMGRIRYDGR